MTQIVHREIHTLFVKTVFVLAALFAPKAAFAVGDSGGPIACSAVGYFMAAVSGTPEQLEAEIERMIDRREGWLSAGKKTVFKMSASQRNKWKEAEKQKLLFGKPECREDLASLLDAASTGGNLVVARYLLDRGASPNATRRSGDTIFMDCSTPYYVRLSKLPADYMRNRVAVLSMLIDRGGQLNSLNERGFVALHVCHEPMILELYISRGANTAVRARGGIRGVAQTPFEWAVEHAIIWGIDESSDNSYYVREGHSLERIRLFAAASGHNSILGTPLEKLVIQECAYPRRAQACREVSKIVVAAPGVFEGRPRN